MRRPTSVRQSQDRKARARLPAPGQGLRTRWVGEGIQIPRPNHYIFITSSFSFAHFTWIWETEIDERKIHKVSWHCTCRPEHSMRRVSPGNRSGPNSDNQRGHGSDPYRNRIDPSSLCLCTARRRLAGFLSRSRHGKIKIVDLTTNTVLPTPFLDITADSRARSGHRNSRHDF